MDPVTIDQRALAQMRPSVFAPGLPPLSDALVREAMTDDFLRMRELLPEAYSLDRLGSAIFYRLPWLLGLGRDLSKLNVLELGCGRGLKAVPWSRLVGRYLGVDLDNGLIDFARRAASRTGRRNLDFVAANAADVVRTPHRFGIEGQIGMVVLYAVVEHLTPSERKFVLGLCREVVQDGGMVVLAETPNRLIPHDGHSTWLPFFQTLPPEIALEYIRRSPRPEAARLQGGEEALYRFGQAASYHEFDLWMADAEGRLPAIISDAWTHWPSFDEPPHRDELALADYFAANGGCAAPAFARYWMDIVFDGAGTPGAALPPPRLAVPSLSPGARIDHDPHFYATDKLVLPPRTEAGFASQGASQVTLFLDLARSAGEIEVADEAGRVRGTLEIDTLRRSHFKRWHETAAVDLSALAGQGIKLRTDRYSTLVSGGLLLR